MSDSPLSQEAKDFIAKVFKCEPPCDSFAVCSECIDLVNFQAGYNFGFRAQLALIEGHERANRNLLSQIRVLEMKLFTLGTKE